MPPGAFMSGRGGCCGLCAANAAVCGDGEGLTLPGVVSLEILY